MDNRKLTDEDIRSIVNALEDRMVDRFRSNIGRGVLSLVWKAIIIVVVSLAAYGSIKGIR